MSTSESASQRRKTHWESAYTVKAPTSVSWYQARPTFSLDWIGRVAPERDVPIIDVGGGASRLIDHLLDAGYSALSVLDISAAALAHARERLGARAARVKWYESDVTAFRAPQPFRVWHDRAVFHFLTDAADRARYLDVLRASLAPGGHVIIATFALDGPLQCSGLDVVRYDAAGLAKTVGDEFVLMEDARESHATPAGKVQSFTYARFQRRADI